MRISNQGLAAVLLGGHGHITESRNLPGTFPTDTHLGGQRQDCTLSHLKATWSTPQRRAPTGKHGSSSPLQHCGLERGSGKLCLSCADSKVPGEAGRWPARVLYLPGRAETRSAEGPGEVRGQAASPLGLQRSLSPRWWDSSPLRSHSRDKRRVLSGSHTVSPELRQTTQAVRGMEPGSFNGGHRAPERTR